MPNVKPSDIRFLSADYYRGIPEDVCRELAHLLSLDDNQSTVLREALGNIRAQYGADKMIDVGGGIPRNSQIRAAIEKISGRTERLHKALEELDHMSKFLIENPSAVRCKAIGQDTDLDCYPGDTLRAVQRLSEACKYLLRNVPKGASGRPKIPVSLMVTINKLANLYTELTGDDPTIWQEDSTGQFRGTFYKFASTFLHTIDESISYGGTIGNAITQVLKDS